jgi:hypothetical protein
MRFLFVFVLIVFASCSQNVSPVAPCVDCGACLIVEAGMVTDDMIINGRTWVPTKIIKPENVISAKIIIMTQTDTVFKNMNHYYSDGFIVFYSGITGYEYCIYGIK